MGIYSRVDADYNGRAVRVFQTYTYIYVFLAHTYRYCKVRKEGGREW